MLVRFRSLWKEQIFDFQVKYKYSNNAVAIEMMNWKRSDGRIKNDRRSHGSQMSCVFLSGNRNINVSYIALSSNQCFCITLNFNRLGYSGLPPVYPQTEKCFEHQLGFTINEFGFSSTYNIRSLNWISDTLNIFTLSIQNQTF